MEKLDKVNWKTDLSGGIQRVAIKHGCAPFGNAKARAWCGPSRIRCRCTASRSTPTRRDLLDKYATYEDRYMLPAADPYESIQKTDYSKDFPIILTSGRLVEYEGGGDETRSNPWLAELQQDMFVEINPVTPTTWASRTATWSGCTVRKAARSRSWPW
jgi:formate dehydrogenase major subunit